MRLLLLVVGLIAGPAFGQTSLLSGTVRSAEEGAMEGVVVSAKKQGATVTTSVVSDATGRLSFPAKKLDAGRYALRIRASGWELEGPKQVEISPDEPATLDLHLIKTKDLSAQLTNAEWLASMPGTPDQKKFLYGCVGCHTLERIAKSKHDAAGFQ